MSVLTNVQQKEIRQKSDMELLVDHNMGQNSTMKIESTADLVTVYSIDALQALLKYFSGEGINYKLLGWGANQLIRDNPDFVYLKLKFPFERRDLDSPHDEYVLPASISLANLTSHAVKFGLKGWEVFTGIPASLGGAIRMNAGTNLGEIGDLVREVKVVDSRGELRTEFIDKRSFSYRDCHFLRTGDVIVEAKLVHKGKDPEVIEKIQNYLKVRNATQPLKEKTCGCMFKNQTTEGQTCRAGQSIDILGLKGFQINGAQVSHKHANFMVNTGGAHYDDICKCLEVLKDELHLHMGLNFDVEFET